MGQRFLFSLVLVLLVGAVLEGLARLAMPLVEHAADASSYRRLWVAEHTEAREIYYEFDVYDPLLGWRAKPNLRDRKAFGNEILNTNSLGLRGRADYDVQPAEGSPRILVLGDSFTFGDEVSDHETFCHYLSGMLPETEVMNFGMHGFGHDQMLILYRELGRLYRPDVVVLAFVYPDIYRNLLEFRDYAKPRFTIDGKGLRLENSPVPTPEETLAREPLRSKLLDAVGLARSVLETKSGRLEARAREVTVRILDQLIEEVRKEGAVPVFLYLPTGPEVLDPADAASQNEGFLLEYCAARAVVCASARPEFAAAAKRGTRFKTSLHWGPAGHRATARALAKLLDRLELSPAKR